MKPKFKTYLKLNMMSLFFIGVSFISVTLAWFAYSGIANVKTEIDVKAWYVEFDDGNDTTINNIEVSLSEIYPGMEPTVETVNIKNYGDSDASLDYSIVSVRILDDEYVVDGTNITSEELEDALSHDYPFHINISLDKKYAEMKTGESAFNISISWPLDSDTDIEDSKWGTDAYTFRKDEETAYNLDNNYQIRASLKLVLKLSADQYIEDPALADTSFNVGDLILYDINSNHSCESLSSTCIKTHVLSVDSRLGETDILLLPDVYDEFITSGYNDYSSSYNYVVSSWNVNTTPLNAEHILNVISKDVSDSQLVRPDLSNSIIGKLSYNNRMSREISKTINYFGYYIFNSSKYDFLTSNRCYWTNTNYNTEKAFAFVKNNSTTTKLYGEDKNTMCSVIPVIVAPKINIEVD